MIIIYSILVSFIFTQSIEHGDIPYESFEEILFMYVDKNGKVDYSAIIENPYSFDKYFKFIEKNSPNNSPEYFPTKDDKMAYWINAYNAIVLKIMIENPEVESILDISFYHTIFFKKHTIGGEKISLNTIEHKILRKKYKDPRIHFAINCGSISCPPLGKRIIRGDSLDEQLDEKASEFINNGKDIRIDHENEIIYLNRIFKWFKDDFGDVKLYICKYIINKDDCRKIDRYKIKYDMYDWGSNSSN